ncbi:MAG: DUF1566 domain-containing protein [Pseudomonadota bacterium]
MRPGHGAPSLATIALAAALLSQAGGCSHAVDGGGGGDLFAGGGAAWPMPNPPATGLPNPQAYDLTGTPGVVLDLVTGLAWQRDVDPHSLLWPQANDRCAALALGGHDDWRLPTLIEMVSLVDFSRREPAIDGAAFPGAPGGPYWTATPFAGSASESWYLAFSTGFSYHGHEDLLAIRMRCVRRARAPAGAIPAGGARTLFPAPGLVHDAYTRLTWQRAVDAVTPDWAGALDRCRAAALPGTGWRLPSMKELQTIIDVNRSLPAIDPAAFPDMPFDQYWTSSPLATSGSEAGVGEAWVPPRPRAGHGLGGSEATTGASRRVISRP